MDSLFEEYQDKPTQIFRIKDYALVKYEKKEPAEILVGSYTCENLPDFVAPLELLGKTVGDVVVNPEKYFKVKKRGITNERQSIISEFVDEINKERKDTKYKPVTGRGIAMKLSVFKTNHELREFYSICLDYKNRHKSFSRRFFGGFKKQEFNK